jgi:ATP/ADP translocase
MKAFRLIGWIALGLGVLLLILGEFMAVYGKALGNFLSSATDFFLIVMVSFIVTSTILVCLLNCIGEKEQTHIEKGKQ